MRFNYLRKYTGYSLDDKNEIVIHYTFKYKRVPGVIKARDLLNNEAFLSTFSSRDAFKIGVLTGRNRNLDSNAFFSETKINVERYWWLYTFLCVLFVISLVISNIFAKRLVDIYGHNFPGGILVFPMTFAILDIITECYNISLARKVIYINIVAQIIFAVISTGILHLNPAIVAKALDPSYHHVFNTSGRIVVAMVVAALCADMINCYLFLFIRNKFKTIPILGSLGIRCIISTAIAEILFSMIWVSIFFYGTLSAGQMFHLITNQYLLKVLYEILALPLTYMMVSFINSAKIKRDEALR